MYDPSNVDLLIVDDDDDFRGTLVRRFRRRGFRIAEASSGEDALQILSKRQFAVAIFDMAMPGISGIELLEKVKGNQTESEVILLTGQGTVESAVLAMKLGAYDYLTKPFPLAELEILIQKAYERHALRKENRQLKAVLKQQQQHHKKFIGHSDAIQRVRELIVKAAPSDSSILIHGETGTGKELVADALYRNSPRADKPLVTVNCAALSESLLESELFGDEKGSFTGATAAKPGLLEVADGGVLFIDEIGEMRIGMQVKLLRVMEDGTFRRVGSIKERRVDLRLISATNQDLEKAVEAGTFREDLFYRINVMSIELPPLRQRTGDIPILIDHFLGEEWSILPEALEAMERFYWPGNIRQLINIIERAKILADDRTIRLGDLPTEIICSAEQFADDELANIERIKVEDVLSREHGNKTRAAETLGISRRSLYRLIEKYGLNLSKQE